MNDYSDEDLLFMTSLKNESEKEAKEAFSIFYNRQKQFLWNLCCKVCQDKDLASDVFNNTMMSIYEHSHTYNAEKSKVKTWMSRIAKNEMLDLLKGESEFIPLNEDICSISEIDNEENIDFTSPEKKILEEALNTLSERDKDILLTYMQYSDGNKHLPDEVIKELCQRYSTLPATLRQIKSRSLEKVNNYITSNKAITINKSK